MTRPKSPRQREREAVMQAWLLEQAQKRALRAASGSRHQASGSGRSPKSEARIRVSGDAPLWLRAAVSRDGDFLVTQCCIVADADVHPFEVRIDLKKLGATLRKLHALGHVKMPTGADSVSGFGSFLGKVARGITHNAVTKAVGKVAKKVVSNPIVQIANPMVAIAAHTTSKALGGTGVIRGPAGKLVDLGTAVAAPAGLAHVAPQALGALGLGMKTVMASKFAGTVSAVAKQAQQTVDAGKLAAAALQSGKLTAAVAQPLIEKAVAVRASVTAAAPKLTGKIQLSKDVKKRLVSIAAKARAGDPDARYTASVIARTAKMHDDISRAQQAAGGGNPGFVIGPTGKVRKAPKGRFLQNASAPVLETLYRGASTVPLRGSFTAVSGADYPGGPLDRGQSWGGADDPGDDYEGPLYPASYDQVGATSDYENLVRRLKSRPGIKNPWALAHAILNRRTARRGPGSSDERSRARAVLELARARHHLNSSLARTTKTKVGTMSDSYDIVGDHLPAEMTEQSDGAPTSHADLIGCGVGCGDGVGADIMIGGLPWYVFTQKGLRHPTIKRRFIAGLKAMPPKMRRRVVQRLRALHLRTAISGAVRGVQPAIGYSLQGMGWAGISGDSSHVAGPLTP